MKYYVWLKQSVIDYIFQDGQDWVPKETGGVLLGYRGSKKDFVITGVIGPGEKAIHRKTSFEPDHEFHLQEISRIYRESECLETYLGDWHTHPNSFPYLSCQDKATFRSIAKHSEARLSNPLMLIAAPPNYILKVWVYVGTKSFGRIAYSEGIVNVFM